MATYETDWFYAANYVPPNVTVFGTGAAGTVSASSPDDTFQAGETIDIAFNGTPTTATYLGNTADGGLVLDTPSIGQIVVTNDQTLTGSLPVLN